jgi:hypothetical protein
MMQYDLNIYLSRVTTVRIDSKRTRDSPLNILNIIIQGEKWDSITRSW